MGGVWTVGGSWKRKRVCRTKQSRPALSKSVAARCSLHNSFVLFFYPFNLSSTAQYDDWWPININAPLQCHQYSFSWLFRTQTSDVDDFSNFFAPRRERVEFCLKIKLRVIWSLRWKFGSEKGIFFLPCTRLTPGRRWKIWGFIYKTRVADSRLAAWPESKSLITASRRLMRLRALPSLPSPCQIDDTWNTIRSAWNKTRTGRVK